MQPIDIYKLLLKSLATTLAKHDYLRFNQNTFNIVEEQNYGFINFQRSQSSTRRELRFTINLGICSKVLLDFLDPEKKPSLNQCHGQWDYRIGHLLTELHSDKWWSIDEQTSGDLLIGEIEKIILNNAIPEIKNNITDNKLLATWLSGKCTGITEIQRLINLSVLQANAKMNAALEITINELECLLEKGLASDFIIRWHLKKLRTKYHLKL